MASGIDGRPWRAGQDPRQPRLNSQAVRLLVVFILIFAGLWATRELDLTPGSLKPGPGGVRLLGEFFSGAIRPALSYQGDDIPVGTRPLLWKALEAAHRTVVFAAASLVLALALGVVLGFAASTAPWTGDPAGGETRSRRLARNLIGPLVYGSTRVLIAVLRSIHELLWAVLFLAAFGISNLAAVLAIALPYAGVLAKIFSEMVDEAPRDSAGALRDAGAGALQVYAFGLIPRALPDMIAYAFYRFECALRSSAILGFFGFPTLGYFIAASFENLYYREVWTYLYVLFALVAAVDWWSGALRRRFVA